MFDHGQETSILISCRKSSKKKLNERETKVALKSKSPSPEGKSGKKAANDSDTDDDDLEGILEKARILLYFSL